MFFKKLMWALMLILFLGGSSVELACTQKSSLQKKTMAYKKKMRKGKSMPCPCEDK